MMFQYDVISEYIAKHLCVLLNDTGIRNDIDNAIKAMCGGMAKSERHR